MFTRDTWEEPRGVSSVSICKSRSGSRISILASVRLVPSSSDKCHFVSVDSHLTSDVLKVAKPAALISQFEVSLLKKKKEEEKKLSNFVNTAVVLKGAARAVLSRGEPNRNAK